MSVFLTLNLSPSFPRSMHPHSPRRPKHNQHPKPHHHTNRNCDLETATYAPPLPSFFPPPYTPPLSAMPTPMLPPPPRQRTHFDILLPRNVWPRIYIQAYVTEEGGVHGGRPGWEGGGVDFWFRDGWDGGEWLRWLWSGTRRDICIFHCGWRCWRWHGCGDVWC